MPQPHASLDPLSLSAEGWRAPAARRLADAADYRPAAEQCSPSGHCLHLDEFFGQREAVGRMAGQVDELTRLLHDVAERLEQVQASVLDIRHELGARAAESARHHSETLGRLGRHDVRLERLERWVPVWTWVRRHSGALWAVVTLAVGTVATVYGSEIKETIARWLAAL